MDGILPWSVLDMVLGQCFHNKLDEEMPVSLLNLQMKPSGEGL